MRSWSSCLRGPGALPSAFERCVRREKRCTAPRLPQNVEKLLLVLDQLHAVARHDDRKLKPHASHLIGPGHILLGTDNGDVPKTWP